MAEENFLPAIEWEPLTAGDATWTFSLPEGNAVGDVFGQLRLTRDADWQLRAVASGESAAGVLLPPETKLRAGQMIPPIPAILAKGAGSTLTLREAHLGDGRGNLAGAVERDISATYGRIVFLNEPDSVASARSCLVWCLNGPGEDFPFTVLTERRRVVRYERERKDFPARERELKGSLVALDAIRIPPPPGTNVPAVLGTTPKGLNVDPALRPCAVEFQVSGTVPVWDQLDPYLAGVSFVLGRRLIPVGFTLFDDQARQRLHELRSAWAFDLRADCARRSMAPTPTSEGVLAALVPRFVDRAASLGLDDAMWLVWLAEAVPLEAALPNLASALECLMSAWFKSMKTKSGGKYMSDADWATVSAEPMKSLASALTGRPNADRIERRARGANNFGVNERFERFFEEISLTVGQVEEKAIAARNKAAHGGSFSPSQYQWLADTVRAYRTLVSRVILALLDWDGNYVDYSTYGFPVRPLSDPLGGPAGDGQAAKA